MKRNKAAGLLAGAWIVMTWVGLALAETPRIACPGLGQPAGFTRAKDGTPVICYDPEFAAKADPDLMAFMFAHEEAHAALQHYAVRLFADARKLGETVPRIELAADCMAAQTMAREGRPRANELAAQFFAAIPAGETKQWYPTGAARAKNIARCARGVQPARDAAADECLPRRDACLAAAENVAWCVQRRFRADGDPCAPRVAAGWEPDAICMRQRHAQFTRYGGPCAARADADKRKCESAFLACAAK